MHLRQGMDLIWWRYEIHRSAVTAHPSLSCFFLSTTPHTLLSHHQEAKSAPNKDKESHQKECRRRNPARSRFQRSSCTSTPILMNPPSTHVHASRTFGDDGACITAPHRHSFLAATSLTPLPDELFRTTAVTRRKKSERRKQGTPLPRSRSSRQDATASNGPTASKS